VKKFIREMLWRVLGTKYYSFLKQNTGRFLDDIKYAEIGTGTYNNGAKVWRWGRKSGLKIGNYCSIAHDVDFILDPGHHNVHTITNYPLLTRLFRPEEEVSFNGDLGTTKKLLENYPENKRCITIGNDVWIGAGVKILPGVSIGDCSTVLAGAVVTKSFQPFSIIGGIPATCIGIKMEPELQKDFLEIAWWDWDKEKIKEHINDFNLTFEEFIARHKSMLR
jgi:acetyltransferase-like isoleucine patch superfamily enzyme